MKKKFLSLIAAIYTVVVFAQDSEADDTDVNINADSGSWYASPWVWVLGAAVFILLLVALTRGGSRRSD